MRATRPRPVRGSLHPDSSARVAPTGLVDARRRASGVLCALLTLCSGLPLPAIVILHDRPDAAYSVPADAYPTLVLVNRPGALGTLIAPTWILTAAHVARSLEPGHRVTVAGNDLPIRRLVFHRGWRTPQTNLVDDVALIELEHPVEEVEPTPLYRNRDELGQQVTFVGRGGTGNGRDGLARFIGPYESLRRATNRVERAEGRWLVFRFDPPGSATDLEGISGPGDSGGPAFVEIDDRLHLMGVSSWQDSREQGHQGVYGVLEYYARVSWYADWIDDVTASDGKADEP